MPTTIAIYLTADCHSSLPSNGVVCCCVSVCVNCEARTLIVNIWHEMIGLHDEIIRFATLKMISFCTPSRQSALFTKCSNQCWSMHIINLNQQVHFLFPYGDGLAASLVAHRQRRNRQNLWMQMQKQTKNDFYITAKPFEFKFSCFFHIPELDSMRTSSTFAPIYWWLNFWTCHLDTVFIGLCVIFFSFAFCSTPLYYCITLKLYAIQLSVWPLFMCDRLTYEMTATK